MRLLRDLLLVGAALWPARAVAQSADEPWLRPTLVHERGPAYILQNDGEYGADGTRYGADEVGQQDQVIVASRTSVELGLGARHTVILLYAPFEVRTQVRLEDDLQFRDERFVAGTVVDHRYLFDGFRGSYLYRVLDGALALEVGASLQIRSAEVAFTSVDGAQRAEEDDIGLVFAPKARLWWQAVPEPLWTALEVDAFSTFGLVSGVRGAIYDVQAMLGSPVGRSLDLFLGARLIGGGADVESQDIYNWANFLAFTVGARIALDALFD